MARVPQERTRNDRKRRTNHVRNQTTRDEDEISDRVDSRQISERFVKESETTTGESKGSAMAKLLKLVISKFGGNWQRF